MEMIRKLTGINTFIIPKMNPCQDLPVWRNIANLSDAILIDRGDLSRQVPLELIRIQSIIQTGKKCGRKVFVATS